MCTLTHTNTHTQHLRKDTPSYPLTFTWLYMHKHTYIHEHTSKQRRIRIIIREAFKGVALWEWAHLASKHLGTESVSKYLKNRRKHLYGLVKLDSFLISAQYQTEVC